MVQQRRRTIYFATKLCPRHWHKHFYKYINKLDVAAASSNLEENPLDAVVLGFNVSVNDDVKESNGATFGKLDQEHIFYLRSRGLKLEEAVQWLVKGFCKDILDHAR